MTYYLADVNVLVAAVHQAHVHHRAARDWCHALDRDQLWLCRFTQMGLLRLLTNRHVMSGAVMTQIEAWRTLDDLCTNARLRYLDEPPGVGDLFRRFTQGQFPRRKAWSDAYLGAVAAGGGLTVATFDSDFLRLDAPALVLSSRA